MTTFVPYIYWLRGFTPHLSTTMNNNGVACRQFFKRHSEAFFIIAFILADCFASGRVLTAGIVLAITYVALPAMRAMLTLDPAGRLTYLKAFIKTPKVQRLAILLFWICSIRWLMHAAIASQLFPLARADERAPSISSALFMGASQFSPFAFLATPIITYAAACLISILWRSRLKATKHDPDLIAKRQVWSGVSYFLFFAAYISGILGITLNQKGPAYMLSNWLLASARDANLFSSPAEVSVSTIDPFLPGGMAPTLQYADSGNHFSNLAFIQPFDTFILTSFSILLFLLFLQPALKLNSLLTSFCWRVVSPTSLQNISEGFLEALRLPSRVLNFYEANQFWSNAGRTLVWLVACYAFLFWLFGFSGGPLGNAIHNWMIASTVDAGFGYATAAPDWVFSSNLRIFLGSIVALYGTAPVAVTASVFLPCTKPRKIIITCDGISFVQGPYLSLWGRQFRLWSDLKSMTVKTGTNKAGMKAQFTLKFRSGGHVSFDNSQMSAKDLSVFLDGVDQYASACNVDHEVYSICQALNDVERDKATSDGITDTAIQSIPPQEFKSTIFIPLAAGDFLPNTRTRIIKQIASKPLCAVYLARNDEGRMVTVKQFYLAEETEETRALEKILKREYELLSALDHPGIAKVLNSFTHEKSTFLLIEHRMGSDMRAIVKEHGARSEALTVSWAQQLCEIMIYLHGREPAILHRDISPDNVIAGEDGQLRLIDFGAAREFLDGITGTMIGKHCYVSPEQLRGEATQRSDIYSFGCTLYFLLTGRDPISLSQSSPSKSMDCSEELDRLIRDCTEFDEDKRPQSFEEVLKRLKDLDKGFKLKLAAAKEKVPA